MKILTVTTKPTPTEGMPATLGIGSDSYGGKIVAVSRTGHRCTWQRVNKDGTTGRVEEFTRRRDGAYLKIGSNHTYLTLGVAKTDLDAGF